MTDTQNYIVTELLGKSLRDKLKENEGPFSLETVGLIGLQLLDRLEHFHSIGFIHCDLKPDNILLGNDDMKSSRSRMLYLIDFGVSRKYREDNGRHASFKTDLPFVGNLVFASVHSHLGYELARRDDMESFMYLLVYLATGQLPWLN